jgi:hypothetical protein
MKNAVFWDVTPCGSCKNSRFEGTYHPHHQGEKLFTAKFPSSLFLSTLIMETILYSKTSFLQEPHGVTF